MTTRTAHPEREAQRAQPLASSGKAPEGSGGAATAVLAPETLEGWYAVHQVWRVDSPAIRRLSSVERQALSLEARSVWAELATGAAGGSSGIASDPVSGSGGGWTAAAELVGSLGQLMVMHFRPTLDEVGAAERRFAAGRLSEYLTPVTTFLSVTEAGLYHITAAVAAERIAAGGVAGDAAYREEVATRAAAERRNPHVVRRLYPSLPADMPYVCFYPMSKRRAVGQNWYALSLEERSRLMHAHGATGRRYAGRVQQVITGAIGLDAWEWGVTLFARDPLDVKRLVTDMRSDEVSAQYAEFGAFYVGRVATGGEWIERVVNG